MRSCGTCKEFVVEKGKVSGKCNRTKRATTRWGGCEDEAGDGRQAAGGTSEGSVTTTPGAAAEMFGERLCKGILAVLDGKRTVEQLQTWLEANRVDLLATAGGDSAILGIVAVMRAVTQKT